MVDPLLWMWLTFIYLVLSYFHFRAKPYATTLTQDFTHTLGKTTLYTMESCAKMREHVLSMHECFSIVIVYKNPTVRP